MSSRPKRSHKAPKRFGAFASPEAQVSEAEQTPSLRHALHRSGLMPRPALQEVEELEEAAPLKRGRRAVAVDSESEGELAAGQPSEEEEESEGSGQEDEEEERPAARRPAKRPRAAAAAAAVEVYVPAPPAEPRPRSDMLSLLFACPALIGERVQETGLGCVLDASSLCPVAAACRALSWDPVSCTLVCFPSSLFPLLVSTADALLEADGLRTISLVARDAANLAVALGVSGAEAAPLWRQMARRCEPGLGADANAEQGRWKTAGEGAVWGG